MTEPNGDGLVDLVDRRVPDRDLPRPEAAWCPVIVSCAAEVQNQQAQECSPDTGNLVT